jgi:hypothetical protein
VQSPDELDGVGDGGDGGDGGVSGQGDALRDVKTTMPGARSEAGSGAGSGAAFSFGVILVAAEKFI